MDGPSFTYTALPGFAATGEGHAVVPDANHLTPDLPEPPDTERRQVSKQALFHADSRKGIKSKPPQVAAQSGKGIGGAAVNPV